MEKIMKHRTLSRVTAIDNSGDAGATYAISGEAETRGGELTAIHNGVVHDKTGNEVATFGYFGGRQMQITYWETADDKGAILAAVEAFVADTAAAGWEENQG